MKFVTAKRLLNIFLYKNSTADDFQLRCQSVDKLQILFLRRLRRIFRFSADMRGGKTHCKRKPAY